MNDTIVKIYGYSGVEKDLLEAMALIVEMEKVLGNTMSEMDGKPLIGRAEIVVVISFLLPKRRAKRSHYIEVLANEDYEADEVIQAFKKNKIEIAENAIFIEAHSTN